jgi:hypothetical protein
VRRGLRTCPGGVYIGPGEEGKGLPTAMAINGHVALMGNQEGGEGFMERKRPSDGGRVEKRHYGLKARFEGGGSAGIGR